MKLFAYIDPGSGLLAWQMVVAAIVSCLFYVKKVRDGLVGIDPSAGRRLSLRRAHGLISKVSKTHRYSVTPKGRRIINAPLAARQASTEQLRAFAA